MKKYLLLFSALFVLAACNSGTNDSKDSTTKSTTTETGKNSSKKSTSTSEKADSTNDSSRLITMLLMRIHHSMILLLTNKHPSLNSNVKPLIQKKLLEMKLGKPMIKMVSRWI